MDVGFVIAQTVDPAETAGVTACPTISIVEETSLPYYFTPNADGVWEKTNSGWVLFGRGAVLNQLAAAESSSASASAAVSSESLSVDFSSTLPKGWGSTSDRSSLYAVPLIVVSSVVLSVLIVAFISL
jgi:hypothetical protein